MESGITSHGIELHGRDGHGDGKIYVVTTKKARSETLTDHVHFSDILLRQTKITEQLYT